MRTRISQNPLAPLLTGSGALAAVSALAVTGLSLTGLQHLAPVEPEAPTGQESVAQQAAWHDAPATTALTGALNAPPEGWRAEGDIQQTVTAPLPYSCPLPGAAASTALARSFTADGHRVRITVLAFTAGLGAEAVRLQVANTDICAPNAAAWSSALSGPGRDARITTATQGGVSTTTLMSRRGDVITYVTGAPGAPFEDLAGDFDNVLTSRLDGVCLDQESDTAAAARSPFAPAGYRPYMESVKVSIPEPALPTAPSATVKPVAVPAPDLVPEAAEPLPVPEYPVHPQMPEPLQLPRLPDAPPAKAVTETSVMVPAKDAAGPGCGWAFTGMKGPAFDADAAARTRMALTSEAGARLSVEARKWQQDVSAYWKDYAAYAKAAAAYNSYRTKVAEVNSAWARIGTSWDDYRVKDEEHRISVKAREDLIARKAEAATQYKKAAEACASPSPSPTPTSTPSPTGKATAAPTAAPTPSPTETATASPSPTPTPECPAARPAVLDEEVPPLPKAPTPPADPRPGP